MATEDDDLVLGDIFTEPPRPPTPEPTIETYARVQNGQDWSSIEIRLVGWNPLWGHHLWNAARAFATYLDTRPELYRNRCVLELGAGGGLPGLVTAKNNAKSVVLTDYPDASLVKNLKFNVEKNVSEDIKDRVHVEGYIWGRPTQPLLDLLPTQSQGFDLIIMSDLIFNHSQHDALLKTCDEALSKSTPDQQSPPCLLVFYSHHRPHLAHRDMEFFEKAKERGWSCEKVITETFPPMFPDDPGDEEVRATVHGWLLARI